MVLLMVLARHFGYIKLRWPPRVTLGRLLPHARGLGFKPRRGGFPLGAEKEWGLSPKAKVRVLHTAQLDVTRSFFVSCVMYIMTSRPGTRVSVQSPFRDVTDWYLEPRLWQLWLFLFLWTYQSRVWDPLFSRVILIGSISVEVAVAPEVRAAAVASPTGVLELDTYSSLEADPSESSPPPIPTAPILPAPSAIVASSSEFPLAPVVAPLEIQLRYTSHHLDHFTYKSSSSHSSSNHSSYGHSSLGHSLSRHTPPDTTDTDSSTPPRFVHPPLARTPWCSEAYLR
nr:hypothetical protein [Tanacetum cinerariifolium]